MDITKAARIAREYVKDQVAEIGDDHPPGIFRAIGEALTDQEAAALGVALLLRNETLSDPPYKFHGGQYDPRLRACAEALGWSP